jgi:hypothetical protein
LVNSHESSRTAQIVASGRGVAAAPHASPQEVQSPQPTAHSYPEPARETGGGPMPNVLWICADQQRFVQTPNLLKLILLPA